MKGKSSKINIIIYPNLIRLKNILKIIPQTFHLFPWRFAGEMQAKSSSNSVSPRLKTKSLSTLAPQRFA